MTVVCISSQLQAPGSNTSAWADTGSGGLATEKALHLHLGVLLSQVPPPQSDISQQLLSSMSASCAKPLT